MRRLPPTSPAGKLARDSSAAAGFAGNRPLTRPCVEPGPSDTGTRIFAEGEGCRTSYLNDVGSDPENSQEIFAEDGPRIRVAGPDLIERPGLILEDPVLPAAREKRRIRSEQQP